MADFIKEEQKDSYGYDCAYYPSKSIDELKQLSTRIYESVGFNSRGFIKKHINTLENNNIQGICDLYIDKKKMETIIKNKKNIASGNIKKNLTFVITTCKRLNFFIETMDSFLYHCQDLYIINRWLCIDDNSSEDDRSIMKEKYPFFEFIFKNEEAKGHAKSLNIMLEKVKTKYILMFEDDWKCNMAFYLEPYMSLLSEGKYDQILFHTRIIDQDLPKHVNVMNANNKDIFEYSHFYHCPIKPRLQGKYYENFTRIEKELDIVNKVDTTANHGFHHPGFSLNPSIFSLDKIRKNKMKFRDGKEFNDTFEIYFAFECLLNKFKVLFTKLEIYHSGYFNSSYTLNGMKRCTDE